MGDELAVKLAAKMGTRTAELWAGIQVRLKGLKQAGRLVEWKVVCSDHSMEGMLDCNSVAG